MVRLNGTASFTIPNSMSRLWYDHEGVPEVSAHGSLIAVTSADCGGYTGTISMTVTLSWNVVFNGPEIPAITGGAGGSIHPDSGWYDLFTTSDGSWNSGYLTFKMSHGGQMVPFSSAMAGVVYTVDGDTKVTYVDSSKAEQKCSYFSLVIGYDVPGLVLHSTLQHAKDYQRTGDVTNIIPYYTAGKTITPSVPRFKLAEELTIHEEPHDRLSDLETKVDEMFRLMSLHFREKVDDSSERGSHHCSMLSDFEAVGGY